MHPRTATRRRRPLLCAMFFLALPATFAVNLALHKPYTMPAPNYKLCTDPDDATQLTDGQRTTGHFWTSKTTVGWSSSRPIEITIDLGKVQPIGGISLSTAGGVADVHWPTGILVLLSDDKRAWVLAGDLVELSDKEDPAPAYGTYNTHVYQTDQITGRARYVKLVAETGQVFLFVDEIEVIEGDPGLLEQPTEGPVVGDVRNFVTKHAFARLLRAELMRDLQAVRDDIATSPAAARAASEQRAQELATRVGLTVIEDTKAFRAVVPMVPLQREIFQLQAKVWQAQGKPPLRLWQSHRWDPLAATAEPMPNAPAPVVQTAMMQNEYRADVLNVTNASDQEMVLQLRIEGVPGRPHPPWLTVRQVLAVGTRRFVAVAAALPEAERNARGWTIRVPAGMTRQIWFDVCSKMLPPGLRRGQIVLAGGPGAPQTTPLVIRVHDLQFPKETTLNLGGWAYTDRVGAGGVTEQNREELVAYLREHYVNAPWATNGILPRGTFNEAGDFVELPDTDRFDSFRKFWPGARHYMVYVAQGDGGGFKKEFAGFDLGTPAFENALANWARFWAAYMRRSGLQPEQLALLIIDEPHGTEWYDALSQYTRVINRAAPELTLWVDPQVHDAETCLEMLRSVDVIVPHRPQWLAQKPWFHDLFRQMHGEGKQLGLYSADGPARTFDPFAYYLLQQWHCFKIGGTWAGFWSFGGDSRFSVWNEYAAAGRGSYCPSFMGPEDVTPGKYMEAVREGVQDYEYLVMLRQRIALLTANGRQHAALPAARKLLAEACDRVLVEAGPKAYRWDQPRNRTVADTVRQEILAALTALPRK
jgi:hypothetical protein